MQILRFSIQYGPGQVTLQGPLYPLKCFSVTVRTHTCKSAKHHVLPWRSWKSCLCRKGENMKLLHACMYIKLQSGRVTRNEPPARVRGTPGLFNKHRPRPYAPRAGIPLYQGPDLKLNARTHKEGQHYNKWISIHRGSCLPGSLFT